MLFEGVGREEVRRVKCVSCGTIQVETGPIRIQSESCSVSERDESVVGVLWERRGRVEGEDCLLCKI